MQTFIQTLITNTSIFKTLFPIIDTLRQRLALLKGLKIYEAEGRWKEKTYGKEIVNSVITMCCNTIYLSQIKSPQTFITRENSNLL